MNTKQRISIKVSLIVLGVVFAIIVIGVVSNPDAYFVNPDLADLHKTTFGYEERLEEEGIVTEVKINVPKVSGGRRTRRIRYVNIVSAYLPNQDITVFDYKSDAGIKDFYKGQKIVVKRTITYTFFYLRLWKKDTIEPKSNLKNS